VGDIEAMKRRRPGCGSELAHGPHESAYVFRADGRVLRSRPSGPGWCAGWTEGEAALCVMLDEVHAVMAENRYPHPDAAVRLECHWTLIREMTGMLLLPGPPARVDHLYGAELSIGLGLPEGGWRLTGVTGS
jgi:hypothetical protein